MPPTKFTTEDAHRAVLEAYERLREPDELLRYLDANPDRKTLSNGSGGALQIIAEWATRYGLPPHASIELRVRGGLLRIGITSHARAEILAPLWLAKTASKFTLGRYTTTARELAAIIRENNQK